MSRTAFASSGGASVAEGLGAQLRVVDSTCGPAERGFTYEQTLSELALPDERFPSLITSDQKIAGNEPVLLGTRIRVALLYAMAEKAGMAVEQIAGAYPHLTVEQIDDALAYARANREKMQEYLARDEPQE